MQVAVYVEAWIPVGQTSESMATDIHNEWGVGYRTACGSSGLLIYLAVESRQIYISRAKALKQVITDAVLHEVMDDMKPLLKSHLVGSALQLAIVELTEYAQLEKVVDCNESAYLLLYWSFKLSLEKGEPRKEEARTYIEHTLRGMDQDRKQALQDSRYIATSCPVCLEDFLAVSAPLEVASETTPLKAGKVEKQDPSGELVGSDGKPLKMLACGHVFDETCIFEWFQQSNNWETNTCPICRQQTRPKNNFVTGEQFDLRAYEEERRFRLERLQARYPSYIEPYYVHSWTEGDHHGALLEDYQWRREVILAEERRHHNASSSSSGGGGGGGGDYGGGGGVDDFGGGHADGGGAGDSW
ncbi:expressed unknown protein [Seminavis robusta]|uniref:RING-type domain-containing protein n=1 Tax=Seminavis robusta TaxID=568900 RepID=A0A9N8DG41_9STRA|nr:expressed unknown protein [Seminavis robusta]|eukprot:Sro102_g052150.1 n/a (357) ;mRNA; f:84579-85711